MYWKGLTGFDFSAYALTLHNLVRLSPGCDLFLQNDSVLGPFGDIDRLIANMRWRLSGFLASSAVENHLQSYALFFRNLQPDFVVDLRSALCVSRSLDHWYDVVLRQETRLARIANRRYTVGSLWFDPSANRAEVSLDKTLTRKLTKSGSGANQTFDPSLVHAVTLLEQGFPFVKRSLFTRNQSLVDQVRLAKVLGDLGFPFELLEE